MQKITIIGNLARKPEERFTVNGKRVISFAVAARVSREKTQWYEVALWEDKIPLFTNLIPYLDKGSKVCVIGDLGLPEPYQGRDGSVKVRMRINPDSINFFGGNAAGPSVHDVVEEDSF